MKYILIFLVTVSVTFTNNVQSQTGAAEVDIRVTQAISNQVRTLREGLMSALSLLRSSINDLEQAVSQTKTRLDSTNNDLSVTKNQMTAMQTELNKFKHCANSQMIFAPTSSQSDGQGCLKAGYKDCYFPGIGGSPGRPSTSARMVKHGEIAHLAYQDGGSSFGSFSLTECQDGTLFSYSVSPPRDSGR